ncbi:transcriptional regulator RbsR [Bacteroidia bacterium]|nr:transcriptional regulator RbsR [Bacteroidia bacterium]
MKKETLITISERTGFSITTVSRVLSGKASKYRICEKTIKLISEEAKQCNYVPSLLAKGLRTRKTHTIGLLVPSIENPYFANIASIVIGEAKNAGYTVVLVDTMEEEENERTGLPSMLSRKVDGIIMVPCGKNPGYIEEIDRNDTPVVLIDRCFDDTTLSYVCTDNYRGGYDATEYLIDNGHRNILCIRGVPYSMPARERERGYCDALLEHGLSEGMRIVGSDFSIRNGYLETKLALNGANRPTAVFAMSNTILLGAIKAIRESSLRIPDDISIISFDNNTYLDFLDPAITRVSQPINDMGTLAIQILIHRMEEPPTSRTQIQLPPQLIVCNSVRHI